MNLCSSSKEYHRKVILAIIKKRRILFVSFLFNLLKCYLVTEILAESSEAARASGAETVILLFTVLAIV